MNVGEFFTLTELTVTDAPYLNEPELHQLINLTRLCAMVLDPLRRLVGPLNVTSGFRAPRVNEHVGGVPNSFHLQGLAADVWSSTKSPKELAQSLGGLEFDKAIIYPDREFMHVQIAPFGSLPRGELLRHSNGFYMPL